MEIWFFLQFLFFLIKLSSCEGIIFPFFICSDYRNQIKLKVNLPLGQETHAYLTLTNKITFLAIDKVKWKKEDRSIEENMTFYLYNEYVQIGENNITMNFYGRYRRDDDVETRNFFPSILSFGYNPQGISTSIVHQFYKSKIINRMIFGIFYYKEKEKGGNIYIGDIPKQLTESKTKGKCKVVNNQWGCEIKDFYYGKYHIKEKRNAIFEYEHKDIFIPKDIYLMLFELFDEFIKNNTCSNKNYQFYCKLDSEDEYIGFFEKFIPSFNFVFDSFTLSIPSTQLFEHSRFLLMYDRLMESNDWRIGFTFIQKFLSVYDYDNKEIILYTDNKSRVKIIQNKNNSSLIRIIYTVLLILLLLGTILHLINYK